MLRSLFLCSVFNSSATLRSLSCSRLPTFRTNTNVTFSKSQTSVEECDRLTAWPLQMGPVCCPETSKTKCQIKPRNIREDWRPQIQSDLSLKPGALLERQVPVCSLRDQLTPRQHTERSSVSKTRFEHRTSNWCRSTSSRSLMLRWFACHIAFPPCTFVEIVVVVQCNALHHKGHNAHLLHVLLPQRRSWPSGF